MKTTMTKELFFKQVKNNVEIIMNDCQIELNVVHKLGNVNLTAIVIRKNDTNIVPNIYLDEYFELYKSNVITINEIVKRVISDWEKLSVQGEVDIFNKLEDKGNFYIRVLNRNLSCNYLQDTFFKEIPNTNLVLVPYIKFSNFQKGSGIAKITSSLLNFLNLEKEEVFEIALKNCKENMKAIVNNMEDVIFKELFDEEMAENTIPDKPTMTVISNDEKLNGATVIFYTDILKQISDKWNNDLIIIPSSIHEVIVLAYGMISREDVKTMIVETNESAVDADEILDNIPYLYKRDTDSIEKF